MGTFVHALLYGAIVLQTPWEKDAKSASGGSGDNSEAVVPPFSFYSIVGNEEVGIELSNRGQQSPLHGHKAGAQEDMDIYRWRKIGVEQKGVQL